MLITIANNLTHCADLPDNYDEPEEMPSVELIHLVKNVRKLVKDNVNMINTIITHGSTSNTDLGGGVIR